MRLSPRGLAWGPGGRVWFAGSDRIVRIVGFRTCRVPDVVAMTEDEARAALVAAGCRVQVVHQEVDGPGAIRVVAQSVPLRRAVPQDTTITLTLGRLSPPCRWPEGTRLVKSVEGGVLGTVTASWGVVGMLCLAGDGVIKYVLNHVYDPDDDGDGYVDVMPDDAQIVGGYVLLSATGTDADGHTWSDVELDRLESGQRWPVVSHSSREPDGTVLTAQRLRIDGTVAWAEAVHHDGHGPDVYRIMIRALHELPLQLATSSASVTDLGFDGDSVVWTEDGVARSASLRAGA